MVNDVRILELGSYEPVDLGETLKRDENNTNRFSFTMPDKDLIIIAGVEKAHASGGDEETTARTTTPIDSTEATGGNEGETDPTTAPTTTQPAAAPASPTKAAASAAKSYAPASGSSAVKTQSVSTGDRNEGIIWIPICAAAAAGIVLTAVIRRKRSQ